MLEAEMVARGKLDLDRVVTAVLDALQSGHALADDCRSGRSTPCAAGPPGASCPTSTRCCPWPIPGPWDG